MFLTRVTLLVVAPTQSELLARLAKRKAMIGSGSPGSAQTQQRRVSGLSGSRKASIRAARAGPRSTLAMPTLAEAETSDSEDSDDAEADAEARAQLQAKLSRFDTQRDRLHEKVGGGASSELMAKLARRRDSTRKLYDTLTV